MSDTSLEYIRNIYGVPAFKGSRIRYSGDGLRWDGTIIGGRGPYIRVHFEGKKYSGILHPTWEVEYLDGAAHSAGAILQRVDDPPPPEPQS
jgi:hypothetical protein